MEHEIAIIVHETCSDSPFGRSPAPASPVIIRRYKRTDVILVPLQEWRRLQRLEADFALAKFTIDDLKDDQASPIKESA